MEFLNLFIVIILGVFGIISIVMMVKLLKEHMDARKQFLENNKKGVEHKFYLKWMILYVLAFLLSIYSAFTFQAETDVILYRATFAVTSLLCITMAIETWVKQKIILTETSFFFETKAYRFKSIASMKPKKGLWRLVEVKTINGETFNVSSKAYKLIEEAQKAKNGK